MVEIIGIQFRGQGKIYYFSPQGTKVEIGDYCVVETSRGTECGEVVLGNRMMAETMIVQPLKPILRLATNEDMRKLQDNARREKEAWEICQKKIEEHELDMKLVEVEYSFDGSKILFYFTSDGRVDFRELVKDLAGVFRTRIELRQIGVRDEAKTLGGLGVCGRPFCCSEYLNEFQPVSIKMAKEQGLSLNPTKISGTCGRLMCCLKYEQDAYEDLMKNTPKVGVQVECNDGRGTVIDANILTGVCKVRIEGREDAAVVVCNRKELKLLDKEGEIVRDYSVDEQPEVSEKEKVQPTEHTQKEEKHHEPKRAEQKPVTEQSKKVIHREKPFTNNINNATEPKTEKAKPVVHDALFNTEQVNIKTEQKKPEAENKADKKVVIHDGLLSSSEVKEQPKPNDTDNKNNERREGNKKQYYNRHRKYNKAKGENKGKSGNQIKTYRQNYDKNENEQK